MTHILQVPVGTTAIKRTTVPFLYNLDANVEGLDVIDFPGVDDRDETIPDLAELLLALVQVVVFVVDYRYTVVRISMCLICVHTITQLMCICLLVYSTWCTRKSKSHTIWVRSCFLSSLIPILHSSKLLRQNTCIYVVESSICVMELAKNLIIHFHLLNRRVHTESAEIWLELLQEKSVPTLVCLTFADKLYAGYMHKDGTHPPAEHVKEKIERELMVNP